VGISYQQNSNGRDQRTYTDVEEAQYIKMSHDPELKDKFIKSIAPSIFGHDGNNNLLALNILLLLINIK